MNALRPNPDNKAPTTANARYARRGEVHIYEIPDTFLTVCGAFIRPYTPTDADAGQPVYLCPGCAHVANRRVAS